MRSGTLNMRYLFETVETGYALGMINKILLSTVAVFCLFSFQIHATPGEISGEVSVAKGVSLKPGGILFIFAKKAGNPMPAAVLRISDPKLPLKFSIGEKNAMSPGTPFDGPFTITARYSPSGDAMDKSGPEGTEAKPLTVGTSNVKIEMKAKK
jgi:hypothetical protein